MSVNHQIDSGSGEIKGGGGGNGEESSKQKKPIGYGRRAKRVVLSKIKKAKKQLQRSKTKENGNSISRSSGCCCLYIRRKPTLDSSSESPTSDPNSSEFGYDSLKGLIEKSDFFLNECNTHFDKVLLNYKAGKKRNDLVEDLWDNDANFSRQLRESLSANQVNGFGKWSYKMLCIRCP
ncbi:hypothetical protein L1887_04686 [Cichorium endivia]|nr:hypothetical protein L1887_04686 [Cichorium endivia]